MGLTAKQQEALGLMMAGHNVFLSGEAGTGKSYVLREFLSRTDRKVMVCAPTGIAAINVAGSTLHRVFGIPIEPILPSRIAKSQETVEKADVIVIDEISMCRFDVFEFVANSIRKSENNTEPKQLIVVGDFLQLPPVLTDKDRKVLEEGWGADVVGDGFAFNAPSWKTFGFRTVVLNEVVRQQGNIDFVHNLNAIRRGNTAALEWFNKNHAVKMQPGITICPKNAQIERINSTETNKLKTKTKLFEAEIRGSVAPSDKPTADTLRVKPEMRVMTLVNDPEGVYQNGSLGTVQKINGDRVIVEFDEGGSAEIEPYKWSVYSYEIKDDEVIKTEIGSITQLPLKPAYAVTIHKSQGQTYDSVNIDPTCFAPGQLYVALSRCKEIKHLHLLSKIKQEYLLTSKEVLDFYGYDSKEQQVLSASESPPVATESAHIQTTETVRNQKSKPGRGGKREGAGRKGKYSKLATKPVRIPEIAIPDMEKWLEQWLKERGYE